jgi:hypothetical protein
MIQLRNCARAAAVVMALGLGGCIMPTPYVDTTLADVAPADRVAVTNPQPVQLLFEFQTKGVRNGAATDQVRDQVRKVVGESGAFSQVGDGPAANGALLSITINNVPLTEDFARNFMTGFTLGLVGSTAGDGYICTIDYIPGPNGQKLSTVTRDAIYATFGTASPPPHVRKVKDFKEAIEVMTHKLVGNGLNDLARNPAFAKPVEVSHAPAS